jgi:hypothetical protein
MQGRRLRKHASTLYARRKEERLARDLQTDVDFLKAEAEEERRQRAEASSGRAS